MNEELIDIIKKQYRLKVFSYHPIKRAWIIKTDMGPFFLKAFVFKDGPRLKFIDGAMRHLIKRGFNHIIPFEETKDGCCYISYNDDIYFLTPFIKSRQCDYDNPVQIAKAASLLAGLHLSSWGYNPPLELNPQIFWGLWPRRIKEKIQHLYTFQIQLKKKKALDEFDKLFLEKFSYYFYRAKESLRYLLETDYTGLMFNEQVFHTFCHHDYEYHNILITPDEHYYIIDFDYLLCDTHLHDLASLLIRIGKRSKWNGELRDLILKTYHYIYPLQSNEIPVLKAMLLFPQDYWQVAFARYFENQPWPLSRFVNEILKKTKQEDLKLKFIRELQYPQ